MSERFIEFWKNFSVFVRDYIFFPISNMTFIDVLDILLLSFLLYMVYKFIRGRHAGRLALGLGVLIFIYVLSDLLKMTAISTIFKNLYAVGIMAICVIFQPELRGALEEVGSTSINLRKIKGRHVNVDDVTFRTVEEISAACFELSSKGEGALIVMERVGILRNQMSEGTPLDALVSRQLLCNIFVNKSPLHDGAVIIRDNRIVAASSKSKNISDNDDLLEGLGTRHRAAVRISEVSDAIVVVVSEETGNISVANNRLLKRHYNDIGKGGRHKSNDLRDDLFKLLTGKSVEDMIPSCADNGDLLAEEELCDLETTHVSQEADKS